MTYTESCPECGKQLSNTKMCTCGWSNLDKKTKTVLDDHCHYFCNEKRCSLVGTISTALYGSAYWFCSDHWQVILSDKEKQLSKRFRK